MHPRDVLLGPQAASGFLPVCDHYSGVEARIRKSLALQAAMAEEFGACVFDATLDCEDGAPAGDEARHAEMVVALVHEAHDSHGASARIAPRTAVRVHPVDHPAFAQEVRTIVGQAGAHLCHLMVPKVESVQDVLQAVAAVDAAAPAGVSVPLQVLVESPAAVHRVFDIAAHPRVQSVSFGLMDFVSAHGGAIPSAGMSGEGQFKHPLVLRAKTEITSACHAHGKVPSHCVVTEFRDASVVQAAARRASRELGFTRMWSIHPDQIRPILAAFAPDEAEVALAAEIIVQARQADWAPIAVRGQLHDRASYRFFWQILERAHRTGGALPAQVRPFFNPASQ